MLKIIKNRKLRIFIIISLILILIGFIIAFIIGRLKVNYRNFYKTNDELVLEQTYNTIFNEIDIDTKMSDIYIKKSVDNNVKVVIYGEEDYININEKNNKLFIDINEKNFIAFDFYSCISKIEIYLPDWYSNVIRITNEYGNIEIDEFINTTFNIKTEYGDISILNGDFARINSDYGNVKLNKVEKARVKVSYGNVNIQYIKDIVVESEHGDINIDNVESHLDLHTEYGDIKAKNIVLDKDSNIKTEYGDISIETTNKIYINAKTDRGKVKIKNNYKVSEVVLKIYNEDGNININN